MADTLIGGTTLVEKESRSIGDVPIGGIIPWAKTLAGVPNLAEGWVECDGSVLVDAQSSLNGQTIPDLNGDNRFLRGNSTSGGTGGSETTNSELDQLSGFANFAIGSQIAENENDGGLIVKGSAGGEFGGTPVKRDISGISTMSPFYDVVWIMRVR